MELLADLEWDEGCVAAYESEQKGFDGFVDLIGRPPAFWGGGGNTWSPEITDAMKRLGIPAYVYALTQLPHEAVHRFNGVFALPQAFSISELDWADEDRTAAATDRVFAGLESLEQPWIGIFVGHPTKFRYTDWWDIPYYGGRTPPTPEYGTPVPQATYEQAKRNLRSFLDRLKQIYEVIGVDEALELPWTFRIPTSAEIAYFRENTSRILGSAKYWPIHYPGLSSDLIVAKAMALADTVEVGFVD
jgi:hypothetical protein